MKKVLVTICAMAAVLACTKTEVTFDEPGEISFAPVSKYATKAAEQSGLVAQEFYVWANTIPNATVTTSQAYFENILFSKKNTTDGYYLGTPSQFWPNATALKFAGVTATGNIGTGATVSMTDFSSISITGYTQPSTFTTAVANDLMWFYADNDPDGYNKQTTAIAPTMNHACSWITFNVKLHSNLNNYWTNVTLNEVAFESLASTGDATITFESANVAWTVPTAQNSKHVVYTGTGSLSSTTALVAESITNNIVVIPQTPTTIAVKYSYKTPAGGSVTETVKNVSLSLGTEKKTVNGVEEDVEKEWQPGVHYTYNLTISAEEIMIAPTASAWTAGPDNLTQNVQ